MAPAIAQDQAAIENIVKVAELPLTLIDSRQVLQAIQEFNPHFLAQKGEFVIVADLRVEGLEGGQFEGGGVAEAEGPVGGHLVEAFLGRLNDRTIGEFPWFLEGFDELGGAAVIADRLDQPEGMFMVKLCVSCFALEREDSAKVVPNHRIPEAIVVAEAAAIALGKGAAEALFGFAAVAEGEVDLTEAT